MCFYFHKALLESIALQVNNFQILKAAYWYLSVLHHNLNYTIVWWLKISAVQVCQIHAAEKLLETFYTSRTHAICRAQGKNFRITLMAVLTYIVGAAVSDGHKDSQ